ncbi:MAG TPA: cytochrome d ubiquinol oxidase subunit II [Candidatus Ignatzschineria merdigallinarum]|uniref:Cytochrome d ubiquinol oxidase subunit II n=1 Tax=Candidatus Ignatzschineria merdigallinarum TaxID=2838621 RepID=A0A9D1Q759_9GAMM|nr:cytochrome d ubiquinol oxidase subunit II [Candidatus Ignatzschineria merdigallinarum]
MDATTILPVIFSGLMFAAVFFYIIFDGYDLGVGLLFPFMKKREDRDKMVATVDPFWDANETWIVLGIGVIFIAFPKAYGDILVALYIPTVTMLAGLILRGAAFDFRNTAKEHHRPMWDKLFCLGSYIATISQGIMVGLYATGLNHTPANWLFAICIGISLCFGYVILGSAWLIFKSEGHIRLFATKAIRHSIFLAFLAIVLVSMAMPYTSPLIFQKWFSMPNMIYLAPIPLLCLILAFIIFKNLRFIENDQTYKRDWVPYLLTVLIVLCTFIGFGYSMFPYIVIDKLTIWEASAAPKSLEFVLWGVVLVLPLILLYTFYVHKIFGGKIVHDEEVGY